MKIIRYADHDGIIGWGQMIDQENARVIMGDLYGTWEPTEQITGIQRVLPPVQPVNIIAIGLNYRRHAAESGAKVPDTPVIFLKLTTSVIGHHEAIRLPADAPDEVDYEAELAVVIGKTARCVSKEQALDHVLGYTCANDVSARDCQQRRDLQWARAKSFDTFCPMGPCLLIDPQVDPNNLSIRSKLNQEIMQESNTSDMIFSVPELISYLSHQFTLVPGTVILTGTPEGVGFARKPQRFLRPGDIITVEINGIGELVNPVLKPE